MVIKKTDLKLLKPQLENLINNYNLKKFEQVEKLALFILDQFPKNQFCWKILGAAFFQSGKTKEALNANKKSIKLNPQDAEAYYNLAITQKELGKLLDAENNYAIAIKLKTDYFEAYSNLGNIQKQLGKLTEAEECYKKAININPKFADPYYNLATILQKKGNTKDSKKNYMEAIKLNPNYTQAYNNLGVLLQEIGNLNESKDCFIKAIETNPDSIDAFLNVSDLLEKKNSLDEGLVILKKFKNENNQKISDLFLYKAIFLYRKNNFSESENLLNKIDFNKLETHRIPIFFNLKANLYDRNKHYKDAFNAFKQMNNTITQTDDFKNYKSKNVLNYVKKIISQINASDKTNLNKDLFEARWKQPIFLIGFPRSGTTLLDTILRTHSKIKVVEEKPMLEKVVRSFKMNDLEEIESINYAQAKNASKIYFKELKNYLDLSSNFLFIDKLPLNILYLPFINQIFPKAKFILSLRHPLDCILSSWMQNFKLNSAMINMCDLDNTFDFYCKTMELYKLCNKRYKKQTHIIRYEDLVDDFEGQIKKLLSFMDLKWEKNLKQYEKTAKQRELINTPSYSQVVKPIYKSSRYRWKNYESYLNNYKSIIDPWIKEYGY